MEGEPGAPAGALVFLHGSGDSGEGIRQWLEEVSSGRFGKQLQGAGIAVVYPDAPTVPYTLARGYPQSVWFDRVQMAYEAPEDVKGIARSVEQVDSEIDKLVAAGVPFHRIGVAGNSMGACLALHVGYGAGRHAGKLGMVASLSTFLAGDSTLDALASGRFAGKDADSGEVATESGSASYLPDAAPSMFQESKKWDEKWEELLSDATTLMIDVRNANELEGRALPAGTFLHCPMPIQADKLDLEKVEDRTKELGTETPILVFCAVGGRSARAADYLRSMGYTNVKNGGGFDAVNKFLRERTATAKACSAPPLFMAHGGADPMVQPAWAKKTRDRLEAAGVPAPKEVLFFPDVGHELCEEEVDLLTTFILKNLAS